MKAEISRKLSDLKKYVDFLRGYQKITLQKLRKDHTLRAAVERYMHLSLEIIIEIGEMIIAYKGFRKPARYREIIEILAENKILPKQFAKRFAPAMGFRNILVHRYGELDISRLYSHLKNDTKDFDAFARYVAKYMKKAR